MSEGKRLHVSQEGLTQIHWNRWCKCLEWGTPPFTECKGGHDNSLNWRENIFIAFWCLLYKCVIFYREIKFLFLNWFLMSMKLQLKDILGLFSQIFPQSPSWGTSAGTEGQLWLGGASGFWAAAPQRAVHTTSICDLWPDQGCQKWQGTSSSLVLTLLKHRKCLDFITGRCVS